MKRAKQWKDLSKAEKTKKVLTITGQVIAFPFKLFWEIAEKRSREEDDRIARKKAAVERQRERERAEWEALTPEQRELREMRNALDGCQSEIKSLRTRVSELEGE